MSDQSSFEEKLVRQLADILNDTHLTEIEYESGGCRIKVARQYFAPHGGHGPAYDAPPVLAPAAPPVSTPQTPIALDYGSNPGAVKSPMVGVAYSASSPESPPFIAVGTAVTKGQTLLIIEAMKVMNQIRSVRDGTVSAILFKDGDPVEFDQVLVVLD